MRRPAILGAAPLWGNQLPMVRPTLRADDRLLARFRDILDSGLLTNGREVVAFEGEVADYLGVGDVVAVNSCTAGLMLTLKCLSLDGPVILPSFTFMATGHAVLWNNLRPVLVDCDIDTFTIDPPAVAAEVAGGASAVLAVHTFGAAVDADRLVPSGADIPLVLDAAHGFGGAYPDGARIGSKGIAEVFSLSPTKPLTAGEGGLIATNHPGLARELRIAREYGNAGDYDSRVLGLNGRMQELSAALGRDNLPHLDALLARRRGLVHRYVDNLRDLPGLRFQRVAEQSVSTYKDFSVVVDANAFGLDRDQLAEALHAENISTRTYFDPPLHEQTVYRPHVPPGRTFPNTVALSRQCLTLPLFSHMQPAVVDLICEAVHSAHHYRDDVAALLEDGAVAESAVEEDVVR